MASQDLEPLESGTLPAPYKEISYTWSPDQQAGTSGHYNNLSPRKTGTLTRYSSWSPRYCHRTPLRLCRLLALLIVLPSLFILIPLYLRYRVFQGQMYPMSMTDMRLIDSKISPTWCQRQVVRSNATFNAFVVPQQPELTDDLVPVSMTRELELNDDMKEYWGFYLLKGSSVTVSACVDHPGASLIMIKGYKHLQECAYIGDDSSEEVDELVEAYNLGLMSNDTLIEKIRNIGKVDGKANQPGTMRRHKAGVSFHDPNKAANTTSSSETVPAADVTDHDPKELQAILEHLHALREAAKQQNSKNFRPPENIMNLPALHRHRDANVDKEERKYISFEDINGNSFEEITNGNKTKTIKEESKGEIKQQTQDKEETSNKIKETNKVNESTKILVDKVAELDKVNKDKEVTISLNDDHVNNLVDNETKVENMIQGQTTEFFDEAISSKYTTQAPEKESNSQEPSSKEVFEDVLQRLQALGDRGKRVLIKLHKTMGVEYHEHNASRTKTDIMSAVTGSGEELDRLRKVLVEAIDEEKTRPVREQKRREAFNEARAKRDTMLGQIELQKAFNENDEARDYAAEEVDLEPDGYADDHVKLNESTPLDMSNSEYWSSFSSSEEALLECEGLILNLPLTHHSSCKKSASEDTCFTAARANALTYRVPANGYYFFVFNSENEVQTNYIRARFDLQKTKYDVARTKLRECTNSTSRCDLSLDIFTSQKVVLELPLRDNDSLWNEQFVIISECEPRTSVYLACVIAVPVLIVIFAFQ